MNYKVFLGGTCNGSKWRDELIPLLKCDYFNPVVKNWTEECQKEELKQRRECHYCLYVITGEITGFYSIAEVVDDSNKRPYDTLFLLHNIENLSVEQIKSLKAVEKLLINNGVMVFNTLNEISIFLNEGF